MDGHYVFILIYLVPGIPSHQCGHSEFTVLLDANKAGIPGTAGLCILLLASGFELVAVTWAEHVYHGKPLAASLLAHPGVVVLLPGASVSV